MVTHDVDEAVYLSERVLVMTPRPGRVLEDVRVPLGYPRNRGASDFVGLRTHILEKMDFAREVQQDYVI
jgi:ABC-type nitrate/sulfonate/bicarbonate transport system ATPase subunit